MRAGAKPPRNGVDDEVSPSVFSLAVTRDLRRLRSGQLSPIGLPENVTAQTDTNETHVVLRRSKHVQYVEVSLVSQRIVRYV